MGEEKVRTRKKPDIKTPEVKIPVTYNQLREGVAAEINKMYRSEKIESFERITTHTVTKMFAEMKEDLSIPKDLDLLLNFNLGIGDLMEKWVKYHLTYSSGLKSNNNKLESLEAKITLEYKRNPDVHNGVLLSDKEIKNLILVNPEYIELLEKINNASAILSVINNAMTQLGSLSYHVTNTVNMLKIKNNLQW